MLNKLLYIDRTFDYVCKELAKVPDDIPVLILGNHCDMSHHQAVTNGQVSGFIENFMQVVYYIIFLC